MTQDTNQAAAFAIRKAHILPLTMLFWLVLSVAVSPAQLFMRPSVVASEALPKIDPNTAPWWEIAGVPGLGESMALRIVAHRQTRVSGRPGDEPVFRRVADLTMVRGIGQKTVERILPYFEVVSPE